MVEVKEFDRAPLGPMHFAADSDGNLYMAGWYYAHERTGSRRESQILMLDHPELQLGAPPTRVNVAASKSVGAVKPAAFIHLSGLPVGYHRDSDALGREHRIYAPAGAERAVASGMRVNLDKEIMP